MKRKRKEREGEEVLFGREEGRGGGGGRRGGKGSSLT